MARSGPKSRFSPDILTQMKNLHERGISQADIARAYGVSQQTVSRELGKFSEVQARPEKGDTTNPVEYVNGFTSGLSCLIAITDHYRTTMDLDWRTMALRRWRERFRKQP